MENNLRSYIDQLFEGAPQIKKTIELKEEMLLNITEKYNDLIADGKTPEAAYNIATASIGDVSDIIADLKKSAVNVSRYSQQEIETNRKSNAIFTSIAVALYIMCILPCLIFQNIMGVVLMFVFIAVATGLIIFKNMTSIKYNKTEDTVVEEFKEWKDSNSQRIQTFKAIRSAVNAIILAIYLVVSFSTGAWHITWIIFIIGGAINNIIKAVFDLRK